MRGAGWTRPLRVLCLRLGCVMPPSAVFDNSRVMCVSLKPARIRGVCRRRRCCRCCRYLFVRCDNAPAPWTSDESGDALRTEVPELAAKEIKQAQGQVFAMSDKPFW